MSELARFCFLNPSKLNNLAIPLQILKLNISFIRNDKKAISRKTLLKQIRKTDFTSEPEQKFKHIISTKMVVHLNKFFGRRSNKLLHDCSMQHPVVTYCAHNLSTHETSLSVLTLSYQLHIENILISQ